MTVQEAWQKADDVHTELGRPGACQDLKYLSARVNLARAVVQRRVDCPIMLRCYVNEIIGYQRALRRARRVI